MNTIGRQMIWRWAGLSGVLAMVATSVQGQPIHGSFGSEQFHRAFLEEKTGELSFEPFQRLNWQAKARASLTWLNFDQPTPAQIARMSSFESAGPFFRSVDFRAPLDPAVNRETYLLIFPGGAVPLQPSQLKGSVDLDFDRDMTVHKMMVSGAIVAKSARAVTTAAFAIVGKQDDVKDVDAAAKFAKRPQTGSTVYDLTDGSRTVTWTPVSAVDTEPAAALTFRMADQRFLLVKWNSSLCNASYTLFTIGGELEPIADNDYDCDH